MLLQLYYVLRSILLRGPLASWQMWRSEQKGDQQLEITTSGFVHSSSHRYYHYQGASYLVLDRIFTEISKMTDCRRLTDIGCGMGRVIFMAEARGFKVLTGIELDKKLYEAAVLNEGHYKRRQASSEIQFVHSNVLDYQFPPTACIYFLFNPFDEVVLRAMLGNLRNVITEECWLIYMNPAHRHVFEQEQVEVKRRLMTGFYTEALIYQLFPAHGR